MMYNSLYDKANMEPRKASSQVNRSSRLPQDFIDLLTEALRERWPEELKSYQLIIEGRVFPEELFLRIGLLESGHLRQLNFEASLDFDPKKDNATALLHLAAEALESTMQTFFAHRNETEFPLSWQEYEWNTRPIYIQTSRVHSQLEKEADRFLQEHGIKPDGEVDDEMPEDVLAAIKEKLEPRRRQ